MSDDDFDHDLFGETVACHTRPWRTAQLGLSLGLPFISGGRSFRLHVFRPVSVSGLGNDTSLKDVHSQEGLKALKLLEAGLGSRWAAALRRRYPDRNQAKLIARDFDVAVRTAKGWLAAGAPFAPVLVRAAHLFGAGILGEVLMPGSDFEKAAHLDGVLVEVEARLAALGDELVVLRKGGEE